MIEQELAFEDVEAIRVTLVICMNYFFLTMALSMLYNAKKQSFAVEFAGVFCFIPEIFTAILLALPLVVLYVICQVSVQSFVVNTLYLCILGVFRNKIIKIMNNSFL